MSIEQSNLSQSFYAENLSKTMLRQPAAVQTAFGKIIGSDQTERRKYYAEKLQALVRSLDGTNLWDHQKQDIRNAQAHIANDKCDPIGISVIPTGGGKTRIFQEETNALAVPVTVNDKTVKVTPRIIQLFPTNGLIRQTKKKYAESFPGFKVGEASGRKMDIQPLTLMTYDLFEQWVAEGKIKPGDFDMLLMDEAHRGLSDARQDAIKPFLKTAVVRAFTATPIFDCEKNVYTLLGRENEVSRFSYDQLITAGHIAPIVNPVLKIRLNGSLPQDSEKRKKLLRELFEKELLDFYVNFRDEKTGERLFGKPFAGYVNTIERAKEMADYFEKGLSNAMNQDASLARLLDKKPSRIAEHISGDHSAAQQDGLIERLINGNTLGVFNDQWMVEGTDVPNLGAALCSPTESLVVKIQSGGRAGRINPVWPAHDSRQTSFVVDTCFELNGKIIGKPRFFFEAINAPSIARIIETAPIEIGNEEQEIAAGDGRKRRRKSEDYKVLDPSVAVNHLLRTRDNGIPKTEDGREYVEGPAASSDRIKYEFFKPRLRTALVEGYPLEDKPTIPKDKIVIAYGSNNLIHPDIKADLDKQYVVWAGKRLPKAPDGWRTGSKLQDDYVGGNVTLDAAIRTYFENKKNQFKGRRGTDEAAAADMTSKEWAGFYLNQNGNMEAWHVSPAGEKEMVAQGLLRARSNDIPSIKSVPRNKRILAINSTPHSEGITSTKDTAMLNTTEMAVEAKVGENVISTIYAALKPAWEARRPVFDITKKHYVPTAGGGEEMPIEVRVGRTLYRIPIKDCGLYLPINGRDIPVFCVNKSYSHQCRAYPLQDGTGMLSLKGMQEEAKADRNTISILYTPMESAWLARDPVFDPDKKRYIPTKGGGEDVPIEARVGRMLHRALVKDCGIYQSGNQHPFCMHRSQSQLCQTYPFSKGTDMLNLSKMGDEAKAHANTLSPIYSALQPVWEARDPVFDPEKKCYIPTVGGGEGVPIEVRVGNMLHRVPVKDCGVYRSDKGAGIQPFFHISKSHMHQCCALPSPEGTGMIPPRDMTRKIGKDENTLYKAYATIRPLWEARDPVFDVDKKHYVPTVGGGEEVPLTIRVGDTIRQIPVKDGGLYKAGANAAFRIDESQADSLKDIITAIQAEAKAGKNSNGSDLTALKNSRPTAPRCSPAKMSDEERADQKSGGNERK